TNMNPVKRKESRKRTFDVCDGFAPFVVDDGSQYVGAGVMVHGELSRTSSPHLHERQLTKPREPGKETTRFLFPFGANPDGERQPGRARPFRAAAATRSRGEVSSQGAICHRLRHCPDGVPSASGRAGVRPEGRHVGGATVPVRSASG